MIKKVINILILFISCANFSFAQPQNAYIEYNSPEYSYHQLNIKHVLKLADTNMLQAQKSVKPEDKKTHLDNAMKNYYIASKINNDSVDAFLGIARIYDSMNLDKLSKEYFSKAINLDYHNPKTNFYFGDYYFKREEYLNALSYYKIAYNYGYQKKYELNLKLGILYEKLANIQKAKEFYVNAINLKPINSELSDKIRILDELNYDDSQYYLFKKKQY